jgi:Bacteriophage tail sheath protein
MPEYLSPGVYVEEIDAGPKPITPVATSTAGFVGVTIRGPNTPKLITSYGDFLRQYGGPLPSPEEATQSVWDDRGQYWRAAESVKAFFDEGGARMYFQRVQPGDAVASTRQFHGGLFALLDGDVTVDSDKMRLSHVVGIAQGDNLEVISEDGTSIGTVTVGSVDYGARTLTLSARAGFAARRGEALVAVLAVDTTLDVLTIEAASKGEWGDDIAVRLLPVVTARLDLTSPLGGAPASTSTTADAAAGATSLTVNQVPGILDPATATPFSIRTRNRIMTVSAVAAAGAALNLTVPVLSDAVPARSTVQKLRTAVNGTVVAVSGASRLYPKAVVQLENAQGKAEVLRVTAVGDGSVTLSAAPTESYVEGDALSLLEGELTARYRPKDGGEELERISGLRLIKDANPNSIEPRINAGSKLVRVTLGGGFDEADLQAFPAVDTGVWTPLQGGDNKIASLDVGDFVGENGGPGKRSGIQALEDIDEVAICVVPGMWSIDVRAALIVHCETLADRFAILDSPPKLDVQGVAAFRSPIDTKYAALYYPWVKIRDPRPGGEEIIAPPSGFIAGVYARTDIARGVHKAPANETLRSIRGLEQAITKREQDILNPQNINVLREFRGRGYRVWGARVLTSDSAWRYVPVRRLFIMIEESIDENTQWVVFEPNDVPLWARVRQSVTNFLLTQWRIGALQGATADEAFFVACDRTTMTQDDIDNGRLICLIGIAPVKPAEFVIFRIQQKTLETVTA